MKGITDCPAVGTETLSPSLWLAVLCVCASPTAPPSFLDLLVCPCSFMLDPFSSLILILFPAPLHLVHGRPVARLRAPQDPVVAANSLGTCDISFSKWTKIN